MTEEHELVREMGCTEADFMRWLPGATRHAPVTSTPLADGSLHCVSVEGETIEIRLRPLPDRRIGGIALPVLEVRFCFAAIGPERAAAFLNWFDHYTRRGGG